MQASVIEKMFVAYSLIVCKHTQILIVKGSWNNITTFFLSEQVTGVRFFNDILEIFDMFLSVW